MESLWAGAVEVGSKGNAESQLFPSPQTLSLTGDGLLEVAELQEYLEQKIMYSILAL